MMLRGRRDSTWPLCAAVAVSVLSMFALRSIAYAQTEGPGGATALNLLDDDAEAVASFEADCDKTCSEMLAAYRALSNNPRDIIASCGDKLEELGKNPERRLGGNGISAGCARATLTYLGGYGLVVMEAGVRCVGQELPDGGIPGMFDSDMKSTEDRLLTSGDSAAYWTQVAFVRSMAQLYADSNTFNADFEKQLIEGGAQPIFILELQGMRREIHKLFATRYGSSFAAGLKKYGPPRFPEK